MFILSSKPRQFYQLLLLGILSTVGNAETLYNFGNPNASEQAYIELINRARANPPAEGVRLAVATDTGILAAYTQYGVNLTMMQNEFNVIAPAAPLAPNANLTSAARGHTLWMLNHATQSHEETSPSNTTDDRITNSGYDWWTYGENIYAYSNSVWYGHVGFQVDWGAGIGGMQSPRGHRTSIHNPAFREIGVGTLVGTNGAIGPQLVTQDFGLQSNGPIFASGVAYYDLNSNDFYDEGEGIAGLTVNASGAAFYSKTAIGGGWVVPIPTAAATRTVTFSGLGISQNRNLVVSDSTNAKVDLKLNYLPLTITSPVMAQAGNIYNLAFTSVGGATGYQWNRWNMSAAAKENCNTLTNVVTTTTSAYSVLNTSIKQQGTASFHLADPGTPGNQIVELKSLFHGGFSPSLKFQSHLGFSTSSEHHKVQVQEKGSALWNDVYNQDGGTPEASFSLKSVNLSTMAGKEFRVRFILNFVSGSTYANTGDDFGWYIDAISFNDISKLTHNISRSLATTHSAFTPATGIYLISVSPVISGIEFPGSDTTINIIPAPHPLPIRFR